MNGKRDYLWLLALIFLSALILKLYFSTQEYLIHNIDAGYYVKHIGEIFTQGYPQVTDPPIAFYYAAAFVSLFGMMLGFKVAIALASAGIAFPVYLICERLSRNRAIGLLGAFFAAFSPTSMFMMGDLFKNEVGLFFAAWFVYFLIVSTDKFSPRSAVLTLLFAGLMVGSHFSTSGYVMFSLAPFLALFPALAYWKEGKLGKEHWFCLAIFVALLLAGTAVILYKGWDISSGQVGVVGLNGHGELNARIFDEYSLFLIPSFLALTMMGWKRQMLFVPWLAVAFLLTQTMFVDPAWSGRFVWDSFVLVAILSALGVGYFWKDPMAFAGISIVLMLFVISGFVESANSTHPVIEEDEWFGMLKLKSEYPQMRFTMIHGGLEYWTEAAGIESSPDAGHTLICVEGPEESNGWLSAGCEQAAAKIPPFMVGEIEWVERFGRFLVVDIESLPDDFREVEQDPHALNPPPQ